MSHFHRKKILVPTDFSDSSTQAVRIARSIAESDADIIVVNVGIDYDLITPAQVWGSDLPPESERERQKTRLQTWAKDNHLGDVKLQIRVGDPGTEVCKLAEETNCQLIVVPSHGRHGVQRVLLGSVAERIIRHSNCSVLLLRRGEAAKTVGDTPQTWCPKHRVVVPIDFSSSTDTALNVALEVVDDNSAIHVVSVIPSFEDSILMESPVVSDAHRRANHQEYLDRYLAERGYTGMHVCAITGNPGTEIATYADEIKADLVVMPSHGYHGLKRLVLGSTTERVIRHCSSPILVLRRINEK